MKSLFKKSVIYILFLFFYFLPSLLFKVDKEFYNSLKGAFVPPLAFIIIWSVIFLFLAFEHSYYLFSYRKYNKKELIHYFIVVGINYLFIFIFPIVFFVAHNLFLGYIVTMMTAMTAILISMESLLLSKKLTLCSLPLVLWSIFATVYSILLYLKN